MKRLLIPLSFLMLLTSCLDVEEYIDLSNRSKPYIYFKLKLSRSADQTPFGASQAEVILKNRLASLRTNGSAFSMKIDRKDGPVDRPMGFEVEGALSDEMRKTFSNTPLSPAITASRLDVPFDLSGLYDPFDSDDTNAYLTTLLGGLKVRLMVKTGSGELVTGARFIGGGVITDLPTKFLKDFYLVEVPLELFAPAYKKAVLQIDLGSKALATKTMAAPDLKSRKLGEMLQKGLMYFDQGDFLTAHGIFSRLIHDKRMVDGDLYFFHGFTSAQIDRDDSQARGYYLLALDTLKQTPSVFPWEMSRERAWLMLGLLYANPKSTFYNTALAKKTLDAGLKENPVNVYIRKVYERVTGVKPPN